MSDTLVIFDCDGVLVDTETVANREMARWLTEAGGKVTYEQSRARFLGKSMESIREIVLAEDGIDLGDGFITRWQNALPQTFGKGVQAIDGITDALGQLKRDGHQICVASSGTIEKMHLTLTSAGLFNMLKDVLFSATMVKNGKPAPDLFLHAAKSMGFEPSQCVVVEDSPYGAQAAKAAGMQCFGYVGDPLADSNALEQQGALVFKEMRNLPHLVATALLDHS